MDIDKTQNPHYHNLFIKSVEDSFQELFDALINDNASDEVLKKFYQLSSNYKNKTKSINSKLNEISYILKNY